MDALIILVQHYNVKLDSRDFIELKRSCRTLYNVCSAVEMRRSKLMLAGIFANRGLTNVQDYMDLCFGKYIHGDFDNYISPLRIITSDDVDLRKVSYDIIGRDSLEIYEDEMSISITEPDDEQVIDIGIKTKLYCFQINLGISNTIYYSTELLLLPDPVKWINNITFREQIMIPNGRICADFTNNHDLYSMRFYINTPYKIYADAIIDNIDYIRRITIEGTGQLEIAPPDSPYHYITNIIRDLLYDTGWIEGEEMEELRSIIKREYG